MEIFDYDIVKNSLFFRLWNKETFRGYEDQLPHRIYGDLAISCLIDMRKLTGMPGTAHFTWQLAKVYGITEDQLFQDAYASAPRLKPFRTETVGEAMQRLTGIPDENDDGPLSVITTEDGLYGASAIMYPGCLEEAAQGRNLFLIPSSVHEFLYMPDDGSRSPLILEYILRNVNEEEVPREEMLSDHLYYYDAGKKATRMILFQKKGAN